MICWMSVGLVEVSGKFLIKAMAFILIIISMIKQNRHSQKCRLHQFA